MADKDIIKEKFINKSVEPMSINQTKTIIYQMEKCICKIVKKGHKGTGFFIKIPFKSKTNLLTVFITNNHVLNDSDIAKDKTIIMFINNTESRHLKIGNNRMVYTNENLDITIIEIKKSDNINDFLELDDEIINNLSLNEKDIINHFSQIYADKSIYLLNYLKGEDILVSYGLLVDIKNIEIQHNCNTEGGSSGALFYQQKIIK